MTKAEAHDLEFRFTPGRLCLDLAATLGERGHRDIERLRTVDDLARWIEARGLGSAPSLTKAELELARQLRQFIFALADAARQRRQPPAASVKALNQFAAGKPQARRLARKRWCWEWVDARSFDEIAAGIALDAIDLLGGPMVERIKRCAEPTCNMLFLDQSRPGTRRWCAMSGSGCGNRAKKAAFLARQRAAKGS